jgi:transcription termination factor Rho
MVLSARPAPARARTSPASVSVSNAATGVRNPRRPRKPGIRPGRRLPPEPRRQYGLRTGDHIEGAARPHRQGTGDRPARLDKEQEKHGVLDRIESVNGMKSGQAKARPDFDELTPLYPQERLRLESGSASATARIIDLVSPVGKGQRGLIVSAPKAGKTMVLAAIAAAVATGHPEVHLMVVLVGERPEEVTDLKRSVRGEVIFSTFDQSAEDHIMVAELAIERAKRLVELGGDVVVLLDSITRLGRAYNLAAPASSRILAGGWRHPPCSRPASSSAPSSAPRGTSRKAAR